MLESNRKRQKDLGVGKPFPLPFNGVRSFIQLRGLKQILDAIYRLVQIFKPQPGALPLFNLSSESNKRCLAREFQKNLVDCRQGIFPLRHFNQSGDILSAGIFSLFEGLRAAPGLKLIFKFLKLYFEVSDARIQRQRFTQRGHSAFPILFLFE